MKIIFPIVIALIILSSCSSKSKQDSHPDDESLEVEIYSSPAIPFQDHSQETIHYTNSNEEKEDYDKGYKAGYDMGYIVGHDNLEYNPYIKSKNPYSYSYQSGYAMGYSAGYEKGQQDTHQGIYADEDEYNDGGAYYYEEEIYYDYDY